MDVNKGKDMPRVRCFFAREGEPLPALMARSLRLFVERTLQSEQRR
ncbi:MAG TPA: hypothetical protein IAA94_04110 [Candidatus Galloscillospira stercoripullorum]|nr:hypothetical protein [Candidatus Galloscillospira stercoripullorum]